MHRTSPSNIAPVSPETGASSAVARISTSFAPPFHRWALVLAAAGSLTPPAMGEEPSFGFFSHTGMDFFPSVDELKRLELKAEDRKIDAKKLNTMVARETEASMNTFLNAIETGIGNLDKHADEFEEGDDPNTQIISIRDARKIGIMPLASEKERR